MKKLEFELRLEDLDFEDIKVESLMDDNSKGLPEMGASVGGITCCSCCCCVKLS
ncbi:thiopeptide-type bacteriocin [Ornithinibacillus halotolerans]|uniref:Thiazolylpeptide-type bacteriocin n=1 Tax=Ornithinibacillus halotolerans TaxID=1274357 RepID=A0A916W486_9BACI|nr:thiopeptide-type bacteriocin [Ornithinibacillus halotolerans]GGA66185.1 hypothetical protein GCM10008025_07520 [Ornithinibacillus halotolerans]